MKNVYKLIYVTFSGDIVDLFFDPSNKLVLTLGDKHVRVFHNVAGYMATIQVSFISLLPPLSVS